MASDGGTHFPLTCLCSHFAWNPNCPAHPPTPMTGSVPLPGGRTVVFRKDWHMIVKHAPPMKP